MAPDSNSAKSNPIFVWLNWSNEDKRKTFIVAILLSLICSLVVATSAVLLKPRQISNKQLEIQRNILNVADVAYTKQNIVEVFARSIEVRLVDLQTGFFVDHPDPTTFDWRAELRDPINSKALEPDSDIAKIKRLPTLLPVYLVKHNGQITRLILPVYGYGLWSTLYGFLAIESDLQTVAGLSFYEHAETPGLGGEVDNPKWRNLWRGKQIYDEQGNIKLAAIRGYVKADSPMASYQVDGLSGATLTTQGVSNLVKFWLSEQGFGAFLKQFKEGQS